VHSSCGLATKVVKILEPSKFAIVLFPGFQALDAFGSLDALNTLAFFKPLSLYVLASSLDPVSTKVPDEFRSPSWPSFHQTIVPTHTFDDAPSDIEVLLVPGGSGQRYEEEAKKAADFIARVYPSLKYLLTVCNGAVFAGRAGVLNGKRATSNKAYFKEISAEFPDVKWVPKARWVEDGNVWTSSGVSAGIDQLFAWMAKVYGEETAKKIADILEYDRHLDPSWDPFAEIYGLA
jgi:transcriptional regulator GlxA family with amidase domain